MDKVQQRNGKKPRVNVAQRSSEARSAGGRAAKRRSRRNGGRGSRSPDSGGHGEDREGQASLPHLQAPLQTSHLPVHGGAPGLRRLP
ncbi:unnamed protein product [Urochloa humidicola]